MTSFVWLSSCVPLSPSLSLLLPLSHIHALAPSLSMSRPPPAWTVDRAKLGLLLPLQLPNGPGYWTVHLARFLLIWTWMTSRFSECIRWMQDDVGMARESPNPSLRSFQPWQKDLLKLQQLCSFPSGPGELQRQSYCNLLHVYICPELIWA